MALASVVLTFIECEAATQYVVGNGRGWTAPPNITAGFYDEWAASKSFEGNDALVFEFNGTHSLAAVSKEEYDSCTKVIPIGDGTNGFSYGYQIPRKAGVYHFICTVGSHCEAGQKLAINVTSAGFATWSPPSPLTSGALSMVLYTFAFFLPGH
ncbi:umecyanin [Eucalyptus grandis]|uniref:umecyanin n=1 Tax=Eucalyptus grandis TaxID=71139 RepID=UPI00192EE227|nr:umecyanin [Eucalyptus grandis]